MWLFLAVIGLPCSIVDLLQLLVFFGMLKLVHQLFHWQKTNYQEEMKQQKTFFGISCFYILFRNKNYKRKYETSKNKRIHLSKWFLKDKLSQLRRFLLSHSLEQLFLRGKENCWFGVFRSYKKGLIIYFAICEFKRINMSILIKDITEAFSCPVEKESSS